MELLRTVVPAGLAPMPVGRYLQGPLALSGTLIKRLKMSEGIRVNGAVVRTPHVVGPGDEIVLEWTPREAPGVIPEPIPVPIVYEDADLIVIDKPAGLVVHPTKGATHGTLANGLAELARARGEAMGIHPVHRIDKDTSGLVLFAKHAFAHQRLDEQLQQHKLARRYLALVWGLPAPETGLIDAPIDRVAGHPVARTIDPAGQHARTHYAVVEALVGAALVGLELETGRTHQIRVHMAHLGHPLIGDGLYAPTHAPLIGRQALHAASLGFHHPRSGEWCGFESPLPPDMAGLLARLR